MLNIRVHSPITSREFCVSATNRPQASKIVNALLGVESITPVGVNLCIEVENDKRNVIWSNYYGAGPANDKPWRSLYNPRVDEGNPDGTTTYHSLGH